MNGGKVDKKSVSTGGFLPHKDPLCLIEGPPLFTISRQVGGGLGAK